MGEIESKFEKTLDELCRTLAEMEDDEERTSLAFYAILELAYQSSGSHFEMLGLLQEAALTLREQSLEDMERDDDKKSAWFDKLSGNN